jgi:HEAT repeat protein
VRGPLIAIALLTATVPAVAQDPAGFEIRAEYLLRRHDQGALPTSMLVAMLRDPYPETRVFAVRVVAASADPSQAMLLAEYLRDRDFRVRYEVMLAAGRFGEAGRGLAFRGLRDEIPKVRQAAAWAACHTGDPALEPLVTRLAGLRRSTVDRPRREGGCERRTAAATRRGLLAGSDRSPQRPCRAAIARRRC